MRVNRPLKYVGVTKEQYDRFQQVAKSSGLNINAGDANEQYDGITVHVKYDAQTEELFIESFEPFWMAPGVVSGHFHELVSKALYRPEEFPKPKEPEQKN